MLIKAGVDISRLERPVRRALNTIEAAYPDFVVTSTYEGDHSSSSLHYANLAIDIRFKTFHGKEITAGVLKDILGKGFDVIEEGTHIHVEWDPK